ncbi:MAG: CBS domain-containing protein [Anaerolineales bacterium]|nr:CBS domain-containing protein [Anaerolineales bacterium]
MTLRVRDLMHTGLLTCPPAATLGQVAALLAQRRVHALLVAEAGQPPIGVIADIDLLAGEWLSADAESLQAMQAMTARELMSTPLVTIAADADVSEAIRRMHTERLHRLVVSDNAQAVGVISVSDVVAHLGRAPLGRRTVAEVMSRGFVVCRAETPLAAAARAMSERRSRSLVVVEASGRALGVVTGYDLLPTLLENSTARTVADLMHPPVTIHPEANLREAVDMMVRHHLHRLVVVDAAEPHTMPLGLISTSDIVAHMAAPNSVWQHLSS